MIVTYGHMKAKPGLDSESYDEALRQSFGQKKNLFFPRHFVFGREAGPRSRAKRMIILFDIFISENSLKRWILCIFTTDYHVFLTAPQSVVVSGENFPLR